MTGNATGMHIHGPANQNSTAGVVFNLSIQGPPAFDNDAAGGGFTGTVNLNAAQEAILLSGNFYVNVHTSANTSGEIRGNLFAIPEPNSIVLVFGLIAAGGFMTRRRK